MNRLADLRPQLASLEEADKCLQDMAQAACRIAVAQARAEHRIADVKARLVEQTAADSELLVDRERALASFITAHADLFQRPRKRATDFGSYGLQRVSDLQVQDATVLLQALLDRGYEDCIKTTRAPVKSAIAERIEAGETFPGCTLRTGDTAVCKVSKALLDEAKEAQS